MSENNTNANPNTGGDAAQAPQRQMIIQKIYVKDASFESPNAPQIFSQAQWQPDVSVQLQNAAVALAETLYEVTLTATITTKMDDKTAYLAEVQQAGIFDIRGLEREELARLLGTICPHTLFPYLRQALDDLIKKGGFPEFLLAPVNFDAIYDDQVRKKQQPEQAGPPSAPSH